MKLPNAAMAGSAEIAIGIQTCQRVAGRQNLARCRLAIVNKPMASTGQITSMRKGNPAPPRA